MKKTVLILVLIHLTLISFPQGGWTKITSGNPIATFTSMGIYKGAAWVDINNDGKTDLFAMPNFLFLNNGEGVFTQLTGLNINPVPLQLPGGCSWGDINNDGYIDFITAQNPSEIYLNNGDNTFSNITASIPSLNGYASWGCALADINNDNRLDLLYSQAYGFHGGATPYPCKLFRQNSDTLTFTPITGYAFTDSLHPYTVPYFDDYDMDGDMDIFIATGPGGTPGPDYCYKNMKKETGQDTLYRMTSEPWAAQLQDGQCYNFIDYDNDGDLDVCLTNYSGDTTRFYKNLGSGMYASLHTPFTVKKNNLADCWGDYDNDGDLDVIIASDNSPLTYFQNNGDGTFTQLSSSITVPSGSSCVVNCDYDNDGDLDVFVYGNNGARSLWRNDSVAGTRHWVNYNLKGVVSNVSAIGAFVYVKAVIQGKGVWQTRHITAQNSFQGQNDLRVHFGLNDATVIDTLLIHWPSGMKEYYTNKSVNQFETLIEGHGTPLGSEVHNNSNLLKIFPNPARDYLTLKMDDPFCASVRFRIIDLSGKTVYLGRITRDHPEIPVSALLSGTYFMVINDRGRTLTNKIVIER
jgi:enediyne biosynthesis protein E4